MNDLEGSPKDWPPLGLPKGSVRALLTLQVVAVVVANLGRGKDIDVFWTETLLIALAHYFTSRRFVSLPPAVIERLQQEGTLDREQQPLYLPRHSIRVLIIAAFVGLGAYLYQEQRLLEPRAIAVMGVVGAYALGAATRRIGEWLARWRKPSRFWGDAKALLTLLAILLVVAAEFLGVGHLLPPEAHQAALGLMLFYFGSR